MSSFVDDLVNFRAIDRIDVDGRPIGELASSRYDPAATEVVACPFSGARRGLPMNATALAQAHTVWPEVVASARALSGPQATVARAFAASIVGVTAPLAFTERHPDEPVPRMLSALFKTSLGYSQVLSTLLLAADGVADAPLTDLGDAASFMKFLDDGKWLVGQVHVCAGPPARIAELFDALAGRTPHAPMPQTLAALEPERFGPVAVEAIALQVADLIARRATASRAPWLRAVFSVPERRPDHAARLFETGAVPPSVQARISAS